MLSLLLLAATFPPAQTEQVDVAKAVLDQASLPIDSRPHTYYLTFSSVAEGKPREDLRAAIRLIMASSSRQIVIERCVPVPVTPTLSRLDLRDMQWSQSAWLKLLREYPYHRYIPKASLDKEHIPPPLVIRADWLLVQLADANESTAYYELLFGEAFKKRDDWLRALSVNKEKRELNFGMVEETSGVAVQSIRWLESFPITSIGGYAWGTRDAFQTIGANDPLENPEGDFDHDGEEWIVSIPKISTATGEDGFLQVYLLSDGDGNRVDKAPVDLVEDSTRFRGFAEIRNPGSCVQCHFEGLKKPTTNGLRDYLLKGGGIYANSPEVQAQLEAFHLRKFENKIDRANEDFQRMVKLVTGLDSKTAAEAFREAVLDYDGNLALEDIAREIGVTPAMLRNALAEQTGLGKPLGARSAGLAHGRSIPREAFEQQYPTFRSVCDQWAQSYVPE